VVRDFQFRLQGFLLMASSQQILLKRNSGLFVALNFLSLPTQLLTLGFELLGNVLNLREVVTLEDFLLPGHTLS
jgi:hypothetical protein